MIEIRHPEWITVEADGRPHLGYDQDWYPQKRQQLAGCGPTAGSAMAAYTRRKFLNEETNTKEEAEQQMLEIWRYATPRMHGLYKTRWLMEGMNQYFEEHRLPAKAEALSIPSIHLLAPKLERVKTFIEEGLSSDWPVGFLNLHSGGEPIPYHWHWMIILKIDEVDGKPVCTLVDEGKTHDFNLEAWLAHTRFGGGFVRISDK